MQSSVEDEHALLLNPLNLMLTLGGVAPSTHAPQYNPVPSGDAQGDIDGLRLGLGLAEGLWLGDGLWLGLPDGLDIGPLSLALGDLDGEADGEWLGLADGL